MASAMTDDRIAVLEAKIARLEAMIATRDEPDAHPPTDESSADVAPVSSRRRLLRNVVIATSGVVAGALAGGATPAAAADPNDLVLGATSTGGVGTFNTSGAPTHAKYLGGLTPTANAFLFEAGNNYTNTSSHPSALAAYTNDAEKVNGVYGRTARFDASGVIGESIAASGTGVLGIGPYGVVGRTAVAFGAGVRGEGVEFGVEGVASSPSGAGTRGTGGTGVVGVSIGGPNAEGYGVAGASLVGTGVAGAGQTYGLESVQSNRAAMLLRADPYDAGAVRIAPPSRTD
ncbi:MAG: hypothetical protein HZB15_06190, partial [Actinobacteria bacterium]|nr:hypothetical protein [Actinomycetota bacterium]